MPPTNKIYDQYVRKARKVADTVDLGQGALGHWVGDRNAENVLIWYHGMLCYGTCIMLYDYTC